MNRHQNAPCSVEPVLHPQPPVTIRLDFGRWVVVCHEHRYQMGHATHAQAIRDGNRHALKAHAQRYRCTVAGCNPELYGERAAESHRALSGHRTAKWPVRSAEGQRRARQRNRSGYYNKYNTGEKARHPRRGSLGDWGDDHPGSEEALGQA